jgi:hypothetical protein
MAQITEQHRSPKMPRGTVMGSINRKRKLQGLYGWKEANVHTITDGAKQIAGSAVTQERACSNRLFARDIRRLSF